MVKLRERVCAVCVNFPFKFLIFAGGEEMNNIDLEKNSILIQAQCHIKSVYAFLIEIEKNQKR